MTDTAATPVFNFVRSSIKDASIEVPYKGGPLSKAPEIDVQLAVEAHPFEGQPFYEVTLKGTVTARHADGVVFLVEVAQAGVFQIENIAEAELKKVLATGCPQMLLAYLRSNIADLITRAGFPPFHLAEVNFYAMAEQALSQQLGAVTSTPNTLQ